MQKKGSEPISIKPIIKPVCSSKNAMDPSSNNILNRQQTAQFVFLFAIAARCLYLFYSPLQDTDYELQHIAASNLLAGKGLAYPRTWLADLSMTYMDPMRYWPPLSALLIAAVKGVTGSVQLTDSILLCTGMVALFLLLQRLFQFFSIQPFYQSLAWFLLAINPEPFRAIGISDLYGTVCLLAGLVMTLRLLTKRESSSVYFFMASFVFYLPAAFRYQYYPLVLIFPFCLLFAGFVFQQKVLVYKGLLSMFLAAGFLYLQMRALNAFTGTALFLYRDEVGFFPSNLVMMYPVLLKAFLNSSYFENILMLKYAGFKYPYLIINAVLLLLLMIAALSYFIRLFFGGKKRGATLVISKTQLGTFLLTSISAAVIILLVIVSLRYQNRDGHFGGWTYVYEARYYMVPALLFFVLLIKWLQEKMHLSIILKFACGFVLLYNVSLWTKYLYNISTDQLSKKELQNQTDRKWIGAAIIRLQKDSIPVVVAYTEPYFAFYDLRENYAVTNKVQQLVDSGYQTSRPVRLLVITQQMISPKEKIFLDQHQAVQIYTGGLCKVFSMIADKTRP